jgi:hypothetical protein
VALTRAQNLDLAIDGAAARLAEVTAQPKPTYTLDGENYLWAEYVQILTTQLLALEQARQRADGAFEVRSQGI